MESPVPAPGIWAIRHGPFFFWLGSKNFFCFTPFLWGPSRHLGSSTAANWVSFDLNVSCSSCWGWSLINTLKLKKKLLCFYYRSSALWDREQSLSLPVITIHENGVRHTEVESVKSTSIISRRWIWHFPPLYDEPHSHGPDSVNCKSRRKKRFWFVFSLTEKNTR